MAKKESKTVRAEVLVNLKYDKDCKTIGDELNIRAEDVSDMVKKGYIKLLKELPQGNEEEGTEKPPKDGE